MKFSEVLEKIEPLETEQAELQRYEVFLRIVAIACTQRHALLCQGHASIPSKAGQTAGSIRHS